MKVIKEKIVTTQVVFPKDINNEQIFLLRRLFPDPFIQEPELMAQCSIMFQ